MRRPLVVLGAFLSVACGSAGARAPDPAATVAELASALRSGDADEVARVTGRARDVVADAQHANGAELHALGETLARAAVDTSGRVILVDGGAITLVRDAESWRVDRGVLGRPALGRPEDAVLALHDALARSRMLAITALMARAPRADLESELARWIDGTADPDALEVSVQGESAIVVTPTGERLELVRESGAWHVLDLR